MYLPTSRIVSYASYDNDSPKSAGNSPLGAVSIEPKDINSGAVSVVVKTVSSQTYLSGTEIQTNGAVADVTATTITVDDKDWFKAGDMIVIGSEAMEITSVSTSAQTITVRRGMNGTTPAAISDNADISYAFFNHYLRTDVGKIMTDKNGRFKQTGAFLVMVEV